MVTLSACQVRTEVHVLVEPDGSGTVTVDVLLDPAAARELGDPATAVSTADLAAAGWILEDPRRGDDGSLTLRASRPFGSPSQLESVLVEVGGVDGVFRDVQLEVLDGFGDVEYQFRSGVELTGSLEQFADGFLAASLDGLPLGRTAEELALLGAQDPQTATLTVRVTLPGGVPETDGQLVDGGAAWSFPLTGGEATSTTVATSATTESTVLRILIGLGVLALIAAVAVAAIGLARRRD